MSLLSKFKSNKNISEYILSEDNQVDKGFISTGCMSLNILFSGRLDGGIPIGKISQMAAPSSLGKCARYNQELELFISDEVYNKFFTAYNYSTDETV